MPGGGLVRHPARRRRHATEATLTPLRAGLGALAILLGGALAAERVMLAMSVAGALATSAAWAGDDDDDDDDGGSGGSGSSGSDDDDDDDDDGGGSGGSGSGSGSSGSGSGDDDDGGSGSSGSGGGDRDDRDDRDDDRGRGRGGDDERRDDDAEEPDDTDDRSGRGRGRGRSGDDAARAAAVPSVPGVLPEPGGSGGERESLSDALLAANLTRAELDAARAAGFRIRVGRELPNLGLVVARLTPPPGVPASEAALRLRALAPARPIDLDHAYALQSDCAGEACWSQELVGWSAAASACRSSRRIGLVDTGVDAAEPALAAAAMRVRAVLPEGLPEASPAHGTAIATLLVGRADAAVAGLRPDAELRVAAVFGQRGGRPVTGALEIATALDWLVAERVEVVNAALAGPANGILELAVARVLRLGIPIVAAAGNAGPDAPPAYPAAYPGVLAVTAVDRTLAVYPRANQGPYVAFAAPGVDLPLPAGGAARTVSGTSYATAFVTAAVAGLGRSADLEAQLARAALDLGPPGRDPVFGWGLVRPAACRG